MKHLYDNKTTQNLFCCLDIQDKSKLKLFIDNLLLKTILWKNLSELCVSSGKFCKTNLLREQLLGQMDKHFYDN